VWPGIPHWPDEPSSEGYGFVLPEARIDLGEVAEVFRRQFPGASVGEHRSAGIVDVVAVLADDWMVRVSLKIGVREDARDVASAGFLRDHLRAAEIATCDRLVDLMVADPGVSGAACEALEAALAWLVAQPGVIAIHPDSGEQLSVGIRRRGRATAETCMVVFRPGACDLDAAARAGGSPMPGTVAKWRSPPSAVA
jgi:hypothetical protein